MAARKLSEEEWDAIDAFRFSTKDVSEFRNALIILKSAARESKASIAEELGYSIGTVDLIRKRFREQGMDGLRRLSPPGRPPQANEEFLNTLRTLIETPPQDLGHGLSVWSAQRLAIHLKNMTGIEFTARHLRRILKAEGFSFQPLKHTMKGKRDEVAYAWARVELILLKKKSLRKNAGEVLILHDELEIHRHPVLSRAWFRRGQQRQIPAPGQNEKKVIYGGVDYKTGHLTLTVADTKCGAKFIEFLEALLAAYPGKRIRMVCDNGRFHHTKAVQVFLEKNRDRIQIYWLPPYSPCLNLIERLWGHMKRTVLANILYRTLGELVTAFRNGAEALNGKRDAMGFMFNMTN